MTLGLTTVIQKTYVASSISPTSTGQDHRIVLMAIDSKEGIHVPKEIVGGEGTDIQAECVTKLHTIGNTVSISAGHFNLLDKHFIKIPPSSTNPRWELQADVNQVGIAARVNQVKQSLPPIGDIESPQDLEKLLRQIQPPLQELLLDGYPEIDQATRDHWVHKIGLALLESGGDSQSTMADIKFDLGDPRFISASMKSKRFPGTEASACFTPHGEVRMLTAAYPKSGGPAFAETCFPGKGVATTTINPGEFGHVGADEGFHLAMSYLNQNGKDLSTLSIDDAALLLADAIWHAGYELEKQGHRVVGGDFITTGVLEAPNAAPIVRKIEKKVAPEPDQPLTDAVWGDTSWMDF